MDSSHYSHYPDPNTQPTHKFLMELNHFSGKGTPETITELAKKCLGIGYLKSWSFNPHKEIFNSVKILMRDVVKMDSFSNAQKEIDGAIRGLNILLKNETNPLEQSGIKDELIAISQYKNQIENIFLLKEALKTKPQLNAKIIDNPTFIQGFNDLALLYGRKRKIEIPIVQSLIQVCINPQVYSLLRNFLTAAHQARQANLNSLRDGELPLIEDKHNEDLLMLYAQLIQQATGELEEKDFKNFKALIDDLFNNRSLITNTQVHKDGLRLAFNYLADDTLSYRTKTSIAKGKENYERILTQLQEAEHNPALDQKKVTTEIEHWKRLENYRSRSGGFIYETSIWMPLIGPEDPIKPVIRTIGFASKEGQKNESSTLLDFTKALGENHLQLSIDERLSLSQFLEICDLEVLKDPTMVKAWEEHFTLPQSIANALESFTNDKFSHLKTLSESQLRALISEALRFTFEVNYHLANDLLNL